MSQLSRSSSATSADAAIAAAMQNQAQGVVSVDAWEVPVGSLTIECGATRKDAQAQISNKVWSACCAGADDSMFHHEREKGVHAGVMAVPKLVITVPCRNLRNGYNMAPCCFSFPRSWLRDSFS